MSLLKYWKSIVAVILTILVVFIGTSLFDVFLSVLSNRFYSTAAFITIFGVGGVFAAIGAYEAGLERTPQKSMGRWVVISVIILIGLLYFFLLSRWEGGEYEMPFKAFGATTAISTLLFIRRNGEV